MRKWILLAVIAAALVGLWASGLGQYLSLEALKAQSRKIEAL